MEHSPMELVRGSTKNLQLLSELLLNFSLNSERNAKPVEALSTGAFERLSTLSARDLEDLRRVTMTNHVILRSFAPLRQLLEAEGNAEAAKWIAAAMQEETARIDHALGFLKQICSALEERGCLVTVIKSLDHWPDLGSDLDLYTDADAARIVEGMHACFGAKL